MPSQENELVIPPCANNQAIIESANFRHQANRLLQGSDDFLIVGQVIKGERAATTVLPFVKHLIAAAPGDLIVTGDGIAGMDIASLFEFASGCRAYPRACRALIRRRVG